MWICDCCSHRIQAGGLTRYETSGQLSNDKCVLAYAAVLKQVFSCRHDLSIEGLLCDSVTQVILFSQCLCEFYQEGRWVTQKWMPHHHTNITWFLCVALRTVSFWLCESCWKAYWVSPGFLILAMRFPGDLHLSTSARLIQISLFRTHWRNCLNASISAFFPYWLNQSLTDF